MKTALIIGDIQQGITGAHPFAQQVVPPLVELLPRARKAGLLVVFVHLAFRPNRADLPPGNALFETFFSARDIFHEGVPGTDIALPVQPEDEAEAEAEAAAAAAAAAGQTLSPPDGEQAGTTLRS